MKEKAAASASMDEERCVEGRLFVAIVIEIIVRRRVFLWFISFERDSILLETKLD